MRATADVPVIRYVPRGAMRDIFRLHDPELVLCGPAGTGKSRAILEKVHLACLKHPNLRALMVRKTRRSLSESGMVTYGKKVLHPADNVHWKPSDQEYQYPNGSILAVGGLDKPQKVMSSEWDLIYVQEATDLAEVDWEALTTRMRNGQNVYQQLIADCNPDTSTHWLKQRANAGKVTMLDTRHEDNPVLFDDEGSMTMEGARYLAILDSLTGVRYLRLRKGLWAAAEGIVYEDSWDATRNVAERAAISARPDDLYGDCGIDTTWPRWIGIDFGFVHPFVARWYAEDGDGRLWMYREIYMTHRLVEDHAADMLRYMGYHLLKGPDGKGRGVMRAMDHPDPLPRGVICDHDAEGRATLTAHLGMRTTAADKRISEGIQAVAARYRPQADKRPRLIILRDSTVARDPWLAEQKLPTCGLEEVESYIWELHGTVSRNERPVKEHDHAMDVDRYVVMHRDLTTGPARMGATLLRR